MDLQGRLIEFAVCLTVVGVVAIFYGAAHLLRERRWHSRGVISKQGVYLRVIHNRPSRIELAEIVGLGESVWTMIFFAGGEVVSYPGKLDIDFPPNTLIRIVKLDNHYRVFAVE